MPDSIAERPERGRTLKRRRSQESECCPRDRRKVRPPRSSSSVQSSSDREEGSPINHIWADWIQESVMAKLKNQPDTRPPSRSRSSGPARKQIAQLKFCRPPIDFVSEDKVSSDRVWDLRCQVHHASTKAFVNENLFAQLDSRYQRDLEGPSPDFAHLFGTTDDTALLDLVTSIHRDASMCESKARSEAQWSHVVVDLLKGVIAIEKSTTQACNALEVVNISTEGFCDSYLPTHVPKSGSSEGVTVAAKKTDIIITWNDELEPAKALRDRLTDGKALNHFHNATTETGPVQCAVEIKRGSDPGATDEAKLQLSTCHAAALGHLIAHSAGSDTGGKELLPLQVGWVVQGHHWQLFVTEYDWDKKRIIFAGPMTDVNMGTKSPVTLLRLVAVLRLLLRWLTTEYWRALAASMKASLEPDVIEEAKTMAGHLA